MEHLFKDGVSDYKLERPKILDEYVEDTVGHLHRLHPDISKDRIKQFVLKKIKENIKVPVAEVINHPIYGVTEQVKMPLPKYLETIKKNIITPYGAMYKPSSEVRSIISVTLDENVAKRDIYKKQQIIAAGEGNEVEEQNFKLLQSLTKITNNSTPGAFGFNGSFLYSIPNYNAITATGRLCVMTGYSHVERIVAGNIYVRNYNDVVQYCTVMLKGINRVYVEEALAQYNLHNPNENDLWMFFSRCLNYYTNADTLKSKLIRYFKTLTLVEKSYILYGYCLKSLSEHNPEFVRDYINDMYRKDVEFIDCDPHDVEKVDEDLKAMMLALNYDVINRESNMGKAIASNPEGVKKFISLCKHVERKLESWDLLIKAFFKVPTKPPRTMYHPKMMRNSVLGSDTDSVIFTTEAMTSWFAPGENFTANTFKANAFTVYFTTQTLKHVLLNLATDLGVDENDRLKLIMKNEFYYTIFVLTSLKKHYVGEQAVQEGKVLPTPKKDIKGVGFRGSNIAAESTEYAEDYIGWFIDKLKAKDKIDTSELLTKAVELEIKIYNSLMQGEKTYLPITSIKLPNEYKDEDPMTTIYFNYVFWDQIFGEKYGTITLPNKTYVMSIKNLTAVDKSWFDQLREEDEYIYAKLMKFLVDNPNKDVTRIVIPMTIPSVPKILLPLQDVRKIIYTNCGPIYILLESLSLSFSDDRGPFLISDFYSAGASIPINA